MREILYRGKAINRDKGFHRTSYKNGDWVYGLVTRLFDERFENLPAEMTNVDGTSGIEVDYNTISQFTTLTDRNGEKIFEGDIVVVNTTSIDEEDGYGVIDWHEDTARFIVELPNLLVDFDNLYSYDCEVIGNIHDNPDLLRGDKNEYIYGE